MLFSYNWLQSFFNKNLPTPEKLADALTMRSFEVKEVKNIILSSGAKDYILDIDILPNRTHDCYSHFGVAKEISALFDLPLISLKKQKTDIVAKSARDYVKFEVKEPALCRRYIAGVMTDIKVTSSPSWLIDRISAIGQKPINNIVDCANYVMFELGQPLHAFDMNKVKGEEAPSIVVRRAKQGEKITTLDNREVDLDESVLIIADNKNPLAIAGIKGGKRAEIERKTKNIIVESANFDPINIRLTSQKIGLRTGASIGFENEISPALAEIAINRVMALIQETSGGKIVEENEDFYPVKAKPSRIVFKISDVSKLLGVSISEKEILAVLEKLGIETKKAKGAIIAVSPLERLDLNTKEDIIEEIGRIHGYGKITAKAPEGFLVPPIRNDSYFYENIIRDLLVGIGFSEIYNYSFVKTGSVQVENPISADKKFLRANLLDNLKDNVAENFKHFDEVRIFEIGKIFLSGHDKLGICEKKALAGLIAYKKIKEQTKAQEFYEIKGALEMIFSRLGITDFWFDDSPRSVELSADSLARIAAIKIGEEEVGFISHNAFELDLEKLIYLVNEEIEYRPVSKYPAMIRDIAILVPIKTKVIDIMDVIENAAGSLLIDTDLFDLYEGEELGEEKKNIAFRLVFQSAEKTLTDKEVNAVMEEIIKAVDSQDEWEVRK